MNQSVDVENQTDAAIAQNRRASEERIALESVTETLDDNFLLTQNFVNQHAALGAVGFDGDDDGLGGIGLMALDVEKFAEAQEREKAAADVDDFAFAMDG